MNGRIGWALAAAAIAVGMLTYGWRGLVLALTVIVFWLLLLFSRSLRVMRSAASRPVGHVDSAVMLNAKLEAGLTMLQVIVLTKSLGQRAEAAAGGAAGSDPEHWRWTDPGGASVTTTLRSGRLEHWALQRPPEPQAVPAQGPAETVDPPAPPPPPAA